MQTVFGHPPNWGQKDYLPFVPCGPDPLESYQLCKPSGKSEVQIFLNPEIPNTQVSEIKSPSFRAGRFFGSFLGVSRDFRNSVGVSSEIQKFQRRNSEIPNFGVGISEFSNC